MTCSEKVTCSECGGNLKFDKQVPDSDPNGTLVDQYKCEDCGNLTVQD